MNIEPVLSLKMTKTKKIDPGSRFYFHEAISRTIVQVELFRDMKSTKRSRTHHTQVQLILRTSITSVILLSVAFIIVYSFILMYVNNRVPLMRHQGDPSSVANSKSGKRSKLIPRHLEGYNSHKVFYFKKGTVVKWNLNAYEDFVSEKPRCQKSNKIIILITSATENFDRRNSIRATWCNRTNMNATISLWQCVFLIGQCSNKVVQGISIDSEIREHRDVLKGSYLDSYRNLTIKIMHGLNWVGHHCPSDYVLKTDDDVYVNTHILHKLVVTNTLKDNVYIGHVQADDRLKVIRNPTSKWYVSLDQYPMAYYPPYAIGMGYLLSLDVVRKLVNISQYIAPFANEDAYIGVLAYHLDFEPLMSGRFTLSGWGIRMCNFLYLVIIHDIAAEDQYKIFQTNMDALRLCSHDSDTRTYSWL